MTRASNAVITILNVCFLVVALVAIGFSIWFQSGPNSTNLCNQVLQRPLLYIGLSLFVLSLLGLLGSSCRSSFFLWIYLALLYILITAMLCFTLFAILVTSKGVGDALSNKGLPSAKLGDYSNWLQNHIVNGDNWNNVRSCLVKAEFCHEVATGQDADFYRTKLSSTQSGCCKPPTYCGFEFKNVTFWVMPKKGPEVPDSDCRTWSNVQTELCFGCKSCKTSILDNIKNEWRIVAIINVIVLVTIIIVYSIGCCALKNNRYKR